MTGTKKRLRDILVMTAIAVLLAVSIGSPMAAQNLRLPAGGGNAPANQLLNASVKVSTKKKSYKIENGILGIDVSKWNGTINWSRVAKDPVTYAFVRSNYGTDLDPNFVTNAKGAHDNGLYVGAYHYARFKTRAEMQAEAKSFINQLSKVTITYPVVLDLEHTTHGLSKANLSALAKEFMDLVAAQGYTVMLYTGQNYITKYLDTSKLGNYGLWIANWVEQPSYSHKIWQYTNTGKVNGINGHVDVNVAYSNLATKKGVTVSKSVSSTVRQLINERYGSNLSLDILDMDAVNLEISKAFQTEVNKQLGGNVTVNGSLDATVPELLSGVNFTLNETNGRITCLLQSKLFYKGHYTESITGVYDDHTYQAIKDFQTASKLEATGNMNQATWYALLGVSAPSVASASSDDATTGGDGVDTGDNGELDSDDAAPEAAE